MAANLATLIVSTSTDTFNDWIQRTNNVASIVNTNCLTANGSLGITVGNAYVNGFFSANTLIAQDAIRGGNNSSNAVLNVSLGFNTGNGTANIVQYIANTKNLTTNTALQVVDSFAVTTARSVKYLLQVNATAIGFQSTEIMLLHNGTDAFLTEYATLAINNSITIGDVAISNTTGGFTCTAANVAVSDLVTITGTLGGTGTINNYTTGTVYKVSNITGTAPSVTGFKLTTTANVAIDTTAGTPTGLTYTSLSQANNMAVFTVNVASGNVNLLISPTTNSTTTSTVNFQRTTIAV
jgi:hypothetical protein